MKYIAEIGWNFVGDLSLAFDMVKSASDANATFAKFQVWNPKFLKEGPWDTDGRREIYEKASLDTGKLRELHGACVSTGVGFLASVFETRSLDILASIDTECVKIPSHECNNWTLIDAAISTFRSVFLSVGAIDKVELEHLLSEYAGNPKVTLMHCVSTYPLSPVNVNLPKLIRLRQKCSKLGYSSHYTGIEDAVAATALGVTLIEKHFTVDRDLPGRDNKFALLPDDFTQMVASCDIIAQMLTDRGDGVQEVEVDVANVMRGRWNAKSSD